MSVTVVSARVPRRRLAGISCVLVFGVAACSADIPPGPDPSPAVAGGAVTISDGPDGAEVDHAFRTMRELAEALPLPAGARVVKLVDLPRLVAGAVGEGAVPAEAWREALEERLPQNVRQLAGAGPSDGDLPGFRDGMGYGATDVLGAASVSTSIGSFWGVYLPVEVDPASLLVDAGHAERAGDAASITSPCVDALAKVCRVTVGAADRWVIGATFAAAVSEVMQADRSEALVALAAAADELAPHTLVVLLENANVLDPAQVDSVVRSRFGRAVLPQQDVVSALYAEEGGYILLSYPDAETARAAATRMPEALTGSLWASVPMPSVVVVGGDVEGHAGRHVAVGPVVDPADFDLLHSSLTIGVLVARP